MTELPFGFDKPEDSPGFLLWQTTMLWQRKIKKALEPFEVSHAQFVVMALLLWFEAHRFASTQVTLANWSKLDKMTVSKSLKKLAALGLVDRKEHESDTRAKSMSLTSKGKALIRKLVPIVEQIDETFFAKITKNDEKALIASFNALVKSN